MDYVLFFVTVEIFNGNCHLHLKPNRRYSSPICSKKFQFKEAFFVSFLLSLSLEIMKKNVKQTKKYDSI